LTFSLKCDKIIKNEKSEKAWFYAVLEAVVFLTGSAPSPPFRKGNFDGLAVTKRVSTIQGLSLV